MTKKEDEGIIISCGKLPVDEKEFVDKFLNGKPAKTLRSGSAWKSLMFWSGGQKSGWALMFYKKCGGR